MNTRTFITAILAAALLGLLVGYRVGSHRAATMAARLMAELSPHGRLPDQNTPVDMTAAIAQLHAEAQTRNIELTDVTASSPSTVSFRVLNGPEVSLSWIDMGENTSASSNDLARRLTTIVEVLDRAEEVEKLPVQVDFTQ